MRHDDTTTDVLGNGFSKSSAIGKHTFQLLQSNTITVWIFSTCSIYPRYIATTRQEANILHLPPLPFKTSICMALSHIQNEVPWMDAIKRCGLCPSEADRFVVGCSIVLGARCSPIFSSSATTASLCSSWPWCSLSCISSPSQMRAQPCLKCSVIHRGVFEDDDGWFDRGLVVFSDVDDYRSDKDH